ncbi:hypothetical protein MH117_02955 [Paenibacillus sp. ACRRX]|uniref:hypothetical protein n=1 Tax=Paenibacillus sp. ACRRX TaxID=2918206 RepID=UPI001EF43A39|nr:hypothetical protein [Paenibacillus sp. ACRRX]MCG7406361.1 hypothetical protein [Paenibacillus sp. ACRRX]
MKKQLIVLTAALSLLILPTSIFAQSNHSYNANMNSIKTIKLLGGYESKDGVLPSSGEVEYSFTYNKSDGANFRIYLGDDNKKGMKLVVYDPDNNEFASGKTNAGNNWRVLLDTKPKKEGDYTIKIVSNDGDGGWDYSYSSAARSY